MKYLHSVRTEYCRACGGDGGFTEPVSMDPFSGHIQEEFYRCQECDGTGTIEVDYQEIEMEDLDEANGGGNAA